MQPNGFQHQKEAWIRGLGGQGLGLSIARRYTHEEDTPMKRVYFCAKISNFYMNMLLFHAILNYKIA